MTENESRRLAEAIQTIDTLTVLLGRTVTAMEALVQHVVMTEARVELIEDRMSLNS
jgi:hypothetical protein